MDEDEEIVSPTERRGLNPFLIPISKSKKSPGKDVGVLCYIRWPTQKEDMDLQLVRTTEAGLSLVAMETKTYIMRKAVEMDYVMHPDTQKVVDLLNEGEETPLYSIGDYLPFFKSGKFPTLTEDDRRVALDKYLLIKVGQFPDCYDRIANNFMEAKNDVSALVTCERSLSIFYGWGFTSAFLSQILLQCGGRDKEARDSAKGSLAII